MNTRKHMWIVVLLATISLAAAGLGFRKAVAFRCTRSTMVRAPQRHVMAGVPLGETKPHLLWAYSKLPLNFEANLGQTDARVNFFSRGVGFTLFLTPTESVMVLSPSATPPVQLKKSGAPRGRGGPDEAQATVPAVLRMKLDGANPRPRVTGLDALSGKSNYFLGNDPKKWRSNVPHYARVEYRESIPA